MSLLDVRELKRSFDLIACTGVLHHLELKARFFRQETAKRALPYSFRHG
jgi:2-polyprenyl-3-methyl-5-hydroxy-6-metoxy-1,4-benzoquinol methylase